MTYPVSALSSSPTSPLPTSQSLGILGGEGPADSLTPSSPRGLSFRIGGPGRNPEVLGVCDSATPAALHHPVYSPSSVHNPASIQPQKLHPYRLTSLQIQGPGWGQGRSLSSILSHYSPQTSHLRVLVHGSVRDNTTVCICFLTLHHQEIGG